MPPVMLLLLALQDAYATATLTLRYFDYRLMPLLSLR